jgi:hypothetical protein
MPAWDVSPGAGAGPEPAAWQQAIHMHPDSRECVVTSAAPAVTLAAPRFIQQQQPVAYQPEDRLFCVRARHQIKDTANLHVRPPWQHTPAIPTLIGALAAGGSARLVLHALLHCNAHPHTRPSCRPCCYRCRRPPGHASTTAAGLCWRRWPPSGLRQPLPLRPLPPLLPAARGLWCCYPAR